MHPIGGYFELELRPGKQFHEKALKLNTARNCLEYVLLARKYKKVYIPFYTCEVLLEPINKLGVQYEFYSIDRHFDPVFDQDLKADEAFLYTNYYGLKQQTVFRLACRYRNLIIDNSQAFYARRPDQADAFYSPRKFFGVADGAYLYLDKPLGLEFGQDDSCERMSHLLVRSDRGAEAGYQDFIKNDNALIDNPIKRMSRLTEKLLGNIDYDSAGRIRRDNYLYLNRSLSKQNRIDTAVPDNETVPMVYPFLSGDPGLKRKLIEHKVFVATYWPNVFAWCNEQQWEYNLAQNLVALPVDQRYGRKEMEYIIEIINHG